MKCAERAVLLITKEFVGTASNVARARTLLECDLEAGHAEEHRDSKNGETWTAEPGKVATILRHEDEI